MAEQPDTQTGGVWEICRRCSKPIVPRGLGTALKPAHEPIVVARKPLIGTVVQNVLEHGTGAFNIDACRVPGEPVPINKLTKWSGFGQEKRPDYEATVNDQGRWPGNLIHDGSDEVVSLFPESKSGSMKAATNRAAQDEPGSVCFGTYGGAVSSKDIVASSGSASRFFYCAKSNKKDRGEGNDHPTVKPTELMRYLVRLVTPKGGTVLDPFVGSGTTAVAALKEGCGVIGIDNNAHHIEIANSRIADYLRHVEA